MILFEDVRRKYPKLTAAEAHRVVELLNKAPAGLRKIWNGEAQMPDVQQGVGPDGLTRPMRELNRFADENALPMPFPLKP